MERRSKLKLRAKTRGEVIEESDSEEESDIESNDGLTRTMPPLEVILEVLKAFPSAIRTRGYGGCLPLHHAARLNYPKEVFMALIRAHPQGLDVRDAKKLTPRDYGNDSGDPEVEPLLDRPSSCWIQQIRDEQTHSNMDEELATLEEDVKELTDDLTKCVEEEQSLQARLHQMEEDIKQFCTYQQGRELEKRAEAIHVSMEKDAVEMRERIEGLFGMTSFKYAEDEKEREYIAAFNDDVRKIYGNANEAMEEMRTELAKLTKSL
uniref:Uncharacterized protein n=1 Tax=Ditylum brightwellii TaxID=49249 RepID=A0A7S4VZA8_9STRA